MAALLEVLPLQIPALRPSSPEARGDRGPRAVPLPGRGGPGGARDMSATVPYVKLCGLRLPESFTPYVDDQKDAQAGTPFTFSIHLVGTQSFSFYICSCRQMGSLPAASAGPLQQITALSKAACNCILWSRVFRRPTGIGFALYPKPSSQPTCT